MLRGVPRSWTKLEPRNGKRVACASLFLLLLLGASGLVAAQDVDVSIESLHIGWVEDATVLDRPALELDQALVGDTIRLSATVKNLGTTTAVQFYVDFFFTETISGEHGKIGSQAVIGLDPGEERRPVVTFDSSVFAPGLYVFSAEADPPQTLTETERCNNFAPLGDCAGTLEQSEDRYQLSLLQQGSHISELNLRVDFEICQMGSLTPGWIVDAHNVGTDAFSFSGTDVEVFGYYRESLDPPANTFTALYSVDGVPQQLTKTVLLSNPGDEGLINITLNYSIFDSLFRQNSELGKANAAQLRISVNPTNGGTPQDLYLPSQFALAQFYSEVDLWTFPARTQCQCDDYTDITSISVDPVVTGGLVFQALSTETGDRVHVLKVRTGEERPDAWTAPTGVTILALAATYDAVSLTYTVFVGGSDGKIYALVGSDKETGSFLASGWISATGLTSGPTFLSVSTDGSLLVVGSLAGSHVLSTVDGAAQRSYTQYAVTASPVFSESTGTLWIASDEAIYGLRSDGSECVYDDVFDQITSPLALNADESVLFFGTDLGSFLALSAVSAGATCELVARDDSLFNRTIVGLDLVGDDADAVIYVTSSFGEFKRVEYDDGRGFDDRIDEALDNPREIAASPAILPTENGKDAAVVFLTGQTRDGRIDRPMLQGWETDLEEYETISVWGTSIPFQFKPEENDVIPDTLLTPIVDAETFTLLVASSDGYLYAFDLSQFE